LSIDVQRRIMSRLVRRICSMLSNTFPSMLEHVNVVGPSLPIVFGRSVVVRPIDGRNAGWGLFPFLKMVG
jgi:hypothetical protein